MTVIYTQPKGNSPAGRPQNESEELKMDLKYVLFFRCKAEYDGYIGMDDTYTEEEKELQRARFMSVYQIIEEAELEDEYRAWKETNPDA